MFNHFHAKAMTLSITLIVSSFCMMIQAQTIPAVSIHSTQPGNLFEPNMPLEFTMTPAISASEEFTILLLNSNSQSIASQTCQSDSSSPAQLTFNNPGYGYYELSVVQNEQEIAKCSLGVLPVEPTIQPSMAGQFGTIGHLKYMTNEQREKMLNLMQRIGISYLREGFLWHLIEPQQNQWQWDRYDDLVQRATTHDINVLPVLCFSSDWASTAPTDLPAVKRRQWLPDENAWQTFVQTTISRYKNQIQHWEIWNEPNWKTFFQPVPNAQQFTQLMNMTYGPAKQADPNCKIISGGLAPGKSINPTRPTEFESLYLQGMQNSTPMPFDVIGYHPYTIFRHGVTNNKTISSLNKIIFEHLQENVTSTTPIWHTEVGCSTIPRITTEKRAADFLAVIMTHLQSLNQTQKTFWYNFKDVGIDPEDKEDMFGLLHYDYTPKPGYFAYRTAIEMLTDTQIDQIEQFDDITIYKFNKANETVWVAWVNTENQTATYTLPASSTRCVDVLGQTVLQDPETSQITLSNSPMYLSTPIDDSE